ncbi:MAG TPA: UbiA family prenyltransferase [Longimicrobiales bacterium]|nr:UbiA family prenyltransferase [Longimicrobiales bacterium]
MTRALRAVWDEFIYGGQLQALGSVGIAWTVAKVFQAPFPWGLPVATYAVSYAVYAYNRLLEVSADAETNPARTAYVTAHRRALWAAFFAASALAAVVALVTATLYGAVFLSVLYAFGLLYTNIFKRLTRFIPGFKSWYVAFSFAVLVFLPFAYTGGAAPFPDVAEFGGWVFWNAAVMQIFLDVKDAESDARAGLRTIPLLLGFESTFKALRALTILSAIPPLLWAIRDPSFPREIAALAVAPLPSLLAFRIAEKGAYQGYLIESGKFISWPALLTVGRVMSA